MSDNAIERAPLLIERRFALLLECRGVLREIEPGKPRTESPGAEAERLLYYTLAGAIEDGLVQTAEHVLTVLRQAHAPLGPLGRSG